MDILEMLFSVLVSLLEWAVIAALLFYGATRWMDWQSHRAQEQAKRRAA